MESAGKLISHTIPCSSSSHGNGCSYLNWLMRDDTIYEDSDVKEALRRLPEQVYNDRMFRIKRALDLSMKQQVLPRDQWTKYEEEVYYLEPYLKEVVRERKEKEEWSKK
ncbi:cytochrome b-c1 complex subunit 7 isoform X2 [Lepisosteus oculatus]|uniref:cytochrome b-c1 complex subunit 7 isoform X2 n=1 Tax=Lepisosteus oculatus TaxID=7918 RepID=UPI00073FD485|nr:PREDICTED: cytochrome b-c1 complex subunit 7 isoform X2 [Lepisosteus oculatus]